MSIEVANEDAFALVVLEGLSTVPEGTAPLGRAVEVESCAKTFEAQSANNEIENSIFGTILKQLRASIEGRQA